MNGLAVAAIYLVGLALLIADLFIGSIAVGVLGVVALCVAVFGAFMVGGPLVGGGLVLGTVAVTVIAFKASLARLTHRTELAPEEGYVAGPTSRQELVGQRGVAETPLRPAGFVRIGGKRVDVVTRGELLETGAAVEVILVEGARVVVKAAPGA